METPLASFFIIIIIKLLLFTLVCTSLLPAASTTTTQQIFPDAARPTDSGYLEINSTSGSSIFYAFYEAQNPTSSISQTPLLIWLQGGPGCSSMTGNFYELGPWIVTHNSSSPTSIQLIPNPGAWNHRFGLLFLDNPIGTGFSYAASSSEIPTDQTTVAAHLHTAITSFLELYPSYRIRPVYITGESYAGKYVPAIGYYIMKRNSKSKSKLSINLAGLAIGNGLTDPIEQVKTQAATAYYSGLINEKQRKELEEMQRVVVELVESEEWTNATEARNHWTRLLQNMTGLPTLFNMRRKAVYETEMVERLLSYPAVKRALGVKPVGFKWEECSDIVGEKLHGDVMKSVRWMVEELLSGEMKMLLYQGREDLKDGVVSVEAWVRRMEEGWSGLPEFMTAERKVWSVKGELAGYVQKSGSLTEVVVLDAGHFVPTDQGVRARVMIEDWVMDKGLFGGGGGKEGNGRIDRKWKKRLRHLSSEESEAKYNSMFSY